MTEVKNARSIMMAKIKQKDTMPELQVRKLLFSLGFRYRLHRKDLPGNPDIVMMGKKVAIFVHGVSGIGTWVASILEFLQLTSLFGMPN